MSRKLDYEKVKKVALSRVKQYIAKHYHECPEQFDWLLRGCELAIEEALVIVAKELREVPPF